METTKKLIRTPLLVAILLVAGIGAICLVLRSTANDGAPSASIKPQPKLVADCIDAIRVRLAALQDEYPQLSRLNAAEVGPTYLRYGKQEDVSWPNGKGNPCVFEEPNGCYIFVILRHPSVPKAETERSYWWGRCYPNARLEVRLTVFSTDADGAESPALNNAVRAITYDEAGQLGKRIEEAQ